MFDLPDSTGTEKTNRGMSELPVKGKAALCTQRLLRFVHRNDPTKIKVSQKKNVKESQKKNENSQVEATDVFTRLGTQRYEGIFDPENRMEFSRRLRDKAKDYELHRKARDNLKFNINESTKWARKAAIGIRNHIRRKRAKSI